MEINTEINKIFGEEMGKLFAAKISDEELEQTAERVWKKMNEETIDTWNGRKKTKRLRLELENTSYNAFIKR